MSGNSSRHEAHHVAMNSTHTGLPLRVARSTVPPPTCGTTSAGAGWPTWKLADVPPLGEVSAEVVVAADALPDGTIEALGMADGDGVITGREGGAWLGAVASGASNAAPAITATPAKTPVRRPRAIGARLDTGRRVPVRAGAGRLRGVAARLVLPWGVSSSCSGPDWSRRP